MSVGFVAILFAAIFGFGGAYFWVKSLKLGRVVIDWEPPTDYCLLRAKVPKENDKTPLAAEQMFSALHGIFREGAKEQPKISFEVISKNRMIQFYIYTPIDLKDFVISQVFSQYPEIDIHEISFDEDYVFTEEIGEIATTELELKRDTLYPIKTFQNFEVDPLSAITGVLSSTKPNEQLWIQTIIRPIADDWQEGGAKTVKGIKEPPKKPKSFTELIAEKSVHFLTEFMKSVVSGPQEHKEEKKDDKPTELTGGQQQAIKGIEEKVTKLGYETQIRITAVAADEITANARLEQVVGAYKQFNTLNQNAFAFKQITNDKTALELFKNRSLIDPEMVFNVTELASLFHFPSSTVETPTIEWAGSRRGEPPANLPFIDNYEEGDLTIFAQTNYRNDIRKFGIKQIDRRLHMYMIGKTGTGKSTLMENMIIDDIRRGRGLAVVDPHGETIQHVIEYIPKERIEDVIYFNPADIDYPVGFNLLENVNPEYKNIIASGVVGVFKKIFGESWGPRLEYILRNTVLALLDYPGSTLLGITRVLTDNAYRRMVVNEIKDPIIRDFFVNEYEKYEPKFRNEAIAPIQNKVGQFLSASIIRNIVGQPKSTIDIRQSMDDGKILLIDLSTGKIGEDNSSLLGSMLITKIQLAAMSRANVAESERRDFYLYVDEFQNFATDSFATILSEARKYHLGLVMTNQYISQLNESVSNAIFGNVGTMVSFRTGSSDAQVLAKEFEPIFTANDIVNLSNYHIYLKMAIDGVTTRAFSAVTLPRPSDLSQNTAEIIHSSRKNFARRREDVEEYIAEWSMPVDLASGHKSEPKPIESDKIDYKVLASPVSSQGGTEPVDLGNAAPAIVEEDEPVKQVEIGESGEKKEDGGELVSTTNKRDEAVKKLPSKIEIIKDRFNRPWYAVGESEKGDDEESEEKAIVAEESGSNDDEIGDSGLENNTDAVVEQGRGPDELTKIEQNDQLVTAEQIDDLANKPTDSNAQKSTDDGFEPLEEI